MKKAAQNMADDTQKR